MKPTLLSAIVALALLVGCRTAATPDNGETPPPSPAASPTPSPEPSEIVLGATGLGPIEFGASRAEVLSDLESRFGAPDESGPGCELRGPDYTFVRFKDLFVSFEGDVFVDYNTGVSQDGDPVLDLKTERGIGVGSTVADLKEAYGDRLSIPGLPAEVFGDENFAIAFPGAAEVLLGGLTSTDNDGTVTGFFTSTCD